MTELDVMIYSIMITYHKQAHAAMVNAWYHQQAVQVAQAVLVISLMWSADRNGYLAESRANYLLLTTYVQTNFILGISHWYN